MGTTIVAGQERAIVHACLISVKIVVLAAILLALSLADRLAGTGCLAPRAPSTAVSSRTSRASQALAMQIVEVVVILLVLIGVPGQLGTMLGLAGAGLTVALKDFIIAFIGWFVLMGRNAVRVGDWVEINGVSGEVWSSVCFAPYCWKPATGPTPCSPHRPARDLHQQLRHRRSLLQLLDRRPVAVG